MNTELDDIRNRIAILERNIAILRFKISQEGIDPTHLAELQLQIRRERNELDYLYEMYPEAVI